MYEFPNVHAVSWASVQVLSFLVGLVAILLLIPAIATRSHSTLDGNQITYVEKSWLRMWLHWEPSPKWKLDYYISKGYREVIQALGRPFKVSMCGMQTHVLPPKYLPMLRVEDRNELSLCQGFENMFNMEITSGPDGKHDHVEIDVVARYLNPRIGQLFDPMLEHVNRAFHIFIPPGTTDWNRVNTFEFGAGLIYRVTARTMVGDELARDDGYIDAAIEYSKSFLMSGFVWPIRPFGPLRDFLYWACTYKLRRDIRRMFRYIVPMLERRRAGEALDSGRPAMDIAQGLLEMELAQPEEATTVRHAHRVLHLTFASSAVSSALVLHAIHQMLIEPHHYGELRTDIVRALDANGGWTENAINDMHLLDSYVRELLRLNPPSVLAGQRTLMNNVRFDDTLALPARSRIAFPALMIHLDADNYKNPASFDPYRFMTARPDVSGDSDGNRNSKPVAGPASVDADSAVSRLSASRIESKYLAFGYGKQACPGRWLAVRQVKMVLAKLVLDYEFKWAGKAPRKVARQVVEGQIFPDISTNIAVRKRPGM